MPEALRIETSAEGAATRVRLIGEITEYAALDRLAPLSGAVVFNMSEVKRINSAGVREWIRFVQKVPASASVVFEVCSPAFINQANMISNFLGAGRVSSLLAPYACEKCGATSQVLVTVGKEIKSPTEIAPPPACTQCGGSLVFDDLEDSYFGFIAKMR